MQKLHKKQQGWLSIELIVVVLAAIVLLYYVLERSDRSQGMTKVATEISRFKTFQNDIQRVFNGESDYSEVDNSLIKSAKIVPDSMKRGSDLVNTFGGDVEFRTASDPSMWEVQSDDYPKDSCIKIATGLNDSFQEVNVSGTTVTGLGDAESACTAGASITLKSS